MKIKIYPSTGDCYYVELPIVNADTQEFYEWTEESISEWIDTNLMHVELWEEN
jgi:hypothetical protein